MTENELDRLLAMLNPTCDDATVEFVKERLIAAGAVRRAHPMSEAQTIDPFERPISNDPAEW
jgi:hypothetical protein